MEIDYIKLVESLNYIKKVCIGYKCDECPMTRAGRCGLTFTDPTFWPLREKVEIFFE